MSINWQKHKAIVFENDDWCGLGVLSQKNREAYERAIHVPEIRAVLDYRDGAYWQWSASKMETPEEMQRLFDLLLSFRGADGRPVIFTPICLAANPNCTAIRDNHFEEYIDMSIADGFPDGRDPGDIIGMAKEGIDLGVWYPQSHGRAHHYNGRKWVRSLREKRDKTLLIFFEFNIIGAPTPPWIMNGAKLAASFDFPGDALSTVWNRMIDGYRGAYWVIGQVGIGPKTPKKAWDPKRLHGPDRWIEVRFRSPRRIDRAVILTASLAYQFQLPDKGGWRAIAPRESVKSDEYHHADKVDVATFQFEPCETDRVRLYIPKGRDWKMPPERVFEIEVYKAPEK